MTAAALPGPAQRRRLAIVPAFNEEGSVADVIDEIRGFDPGFEMVVVDDGSERPHRRGRALRGVHVVTPPLQPRHRRAPSRPASATRFERLRLAVQIDGDGQHDPSELAEAARAACSAGEADLVIGSRFAGERAFRSSFMRRLGIRLLARTVSAIARRRLTDTDLRLPGRQPARRSRSSPPTTRTTTPRSRRR